MLKWLRYVLSPELTMEDLVVGQAYYEATHGVPLFPQGLCPFSKHLKSEGVATRQFVSTRHDN